MRGEFGNSAVQLQFKRADASAAQPGALVYDAALKAPAVARDGAFCRLAVQVPVPLTAASAGSPGDYAVAPGFLYVCVAANTWQRVATATW